MSRVEGSAGTLWSRRRAAVRAEAEADALAQTRADATRAQAEMAKKSDEDILQELDLKDPDQLQQGDDFASFMSAEVPERLRKRALRTLWRSNPVLACVDDLVDYGDDFKAQWDGVDLIKTVYRVGKGMLSDEEIEAQAQTAQEPGPLDPPESEPEALTLSVDEDAGAVKPGEDAEDEDAPEALALEDASDISPEQAETDMPRPRRMRFDFDEVS